LASALIKTTAFVHFDQIQDIASKIISIGNSLNEGSSQAIDRQCVLRQRFGRTLIGFVAVAAYAVATRATVLRLVVVRLFD
jgi:hypothetical protein